MPADPSLGSGAPFLPANFVGGQKNFYNSKVLGYGIGGTNPDGVPEHEPPRPSGRTPHHRAGGKSDLGHLRLCGNFISVNELEPADVLGWVHRDLADQPELWVSRAGCRRLRRQRARRVLNSEYVPTSITGRPGQTDENDALLLQPANYFRGDGSPSVDYNYTQTATATALRRALGRTGRR
jgi:hypothetical protein